MHYLIEDPDLSIDSGPGHPMAVVVEEDALFLGIASQWCAQLFHLVHRGVQALFVTRLAKEKTKEQIMLDNVVSCYILHFTTFVHIEGGLHVFLSDPWFQQKVILCAVSEQSHTSVSLQTVF